MNYKKASYMMNSIQIKQMVLEYVFYLSPEKLIFTEWGPLRCHPQIFITQRHKWLEQLNPTCQEDFG